MKSDITIISSYATDKLFNSRGKFLKEQKGGPAYFITNVLTSQAIRFDVITGKEITVEIQVFDHDEFGKISEKLKPKIINFNNISTPFALISSIVGEFEIKSLGSYYGKVFVDLQGFVRDGNDFGKKKHWNLTNDILENIFCLKATEEEIQYIPSSFMKKQKEKLLLITKGSKGVEMYFKRKKIDFTPKQIVNPPNTIGAGDTFFSSFIAHFIKTHDPELSCEFAMDNTAQFLQLK